MRVDQLLVTQGLAPTRSAAQRLIGRGAVRWLGPTGWAVPRKAGEDVPEGCEIEVTDDAELRWVSRAGLKLDGVLPRTAIALQGTTCLDIGQSTGGFTDVLLARGAARVVGVDVGHGQLHPRLRGDPRVRALEGINARHLTREALGNDMPAGGFDVVAADVSFISLTLLLQPVASLLTDDGHALLLVKPQFELQPGQIGKSGIVRDPASHREVEQRIRDACRDAHLDVAGWFDSPVRGGDGNHEFFVWARPGHDDPRTST
jgi:23S rRNA (cytidine1920-2'-O)/16S rRNA (cytidine1409-2'-O)-methyltransferase